MIAVWKSAASTAVLLAVAGCQAAGNPQPAAQGTVGAALQAHVWRCADDTTVTTRNITSPPAIQLRTGADTRTLPQVRAASGARYEDGMWMFWTRSDGAMLERKPGITVTCREVRAQSLIEDARVRGVTFRGRGNEPGWLLETGPGNRVMLDDRYGSVRMVFPDLAPRTDAATGATVYEGRSADHRLKATLIPRHCTDSMSDETFPYTVELEIDGERRRGCGSPLR